MKNDLGYEVYNQGEYTPPSSHYVSRNPDTLNTRNYYKSFIESNPQFIVEYSLYYKIVFRIFALIVERILKGGEISTPIGQFKLWTVERRKKLLIIYLLILNVLKLAILKLLFIVLMKHIQRYI